MGTNQILRMPIVSFDVGPGEGPTNMGEVHLREEEGMGWDDRESTTALNSRAKWGGGGGAITTSHNCRDAWRKHGTVRSSRPMPGEREIRFSPTAKLRCGARLVHANRLPVGKIGG